MQRGSINWYDAHADAVAASHESLDAGRVNKWIHDLLPVAPAAMHELCRLARATDLASARAADAKLLGVHKALFLESNPIPTKWAMHRLGLIEAGIRLPMTWLSSEFQTQVEAAMQQAQAL